ncbi:zinc finger protein 493 [Oncorhynchus tshawytscha]|uniref:C2H2-type domain-containing protein n=1 Tax=Oncorhynchus tshawytscha TaxID=74940 RepID=A0A8C8J7S8_ONCTS|nr:zinc finger protein 493 [Oncorhynchus tshawytscha]XP_024283668.1 zinc finger protein 493 [Oncorhynchus tshawytscha]
MESIDLEREDPSSSLSGYANGEIMTLEISDVSPDLLVLEVKDNLPESNHGSLDMEMDADFHNDDGHGFANVELQFFPCDACEASFTSEPELEQHFISSHSICDVASERGRLKAKSMETEGVSPLHTCMTCGKVFKYLTSFRKHEETHIKALYTCKTCGKEFKYLTSFTKHQATHIVPRLRGNGKSIIAVGLNVNQKVKGLHTCRHCGKGFKYLTSFIKHEKTHRITKKSRKKQRNPSSSEIIVRLEGNRKEYTETCVRATKKKRKNINDTEDQDACILISSDDELANTAEQQTPDSNRSPPFPSDSNRSPFPSDSNRSPPFPADSNRSPPFPCLDCGKVFKFFKSYQKHQKRHAWAQGKSEIVPPKQEHGPEVKQQIRCPVCGRAFNKLKACTKHEKMYHRENNLRKNTFSLTCCECDRHFEKADIFQKHKCFHLRKHVKAFIEASRVSQQGDIFYCQLCVLKLASGLEFENHAREMHPDQYRKTLKAVGNVRTCIIKDTLKGLPTQRDLEATEIDLNTVGEIEEDVSRQFICKDCGDCFIYHVSFNFCGKCLKDRKDSRRIRESNVKASKLHHCEKCGLDFGRKDHLKRHSCSHSGSSFICFDCGVRFRDPGELRTHEKTHPVRNHIFQLREKRCEHQKELMLHHEVDHPGPDGYTCHQCGKKCSTGERLGKHRMIHSAKTPHVCSYCGTKFKRREHLRRHENLHTNEKPHLSHCYGDTFGRQEDLKTHLGKMHTILRSYLCKTCGTTFKDRNSLRRHRYHTHTKAGKVFQCEECGLSFSRADHLKHHKYTHSTERPFSCSMCYKVFHIAENLKKHERNHRNKWLEYLNTHRHNNTPKQESHVSERSKWKLGWSEASALLKLIQSHSKQQHHTCYVCKNTFRGLYYLKRHRLLNCLGQRSKIMNSF